MADRTDLLIERNRALLTQAEAAQREARRIVARAQWARSQCHAAAGAADAQPVPEPDPGCNPTQPQDGLIIYDNALEVSPPVPASHG